MRWKVPTILLIIFVLGPTLVSAATPSDLQAQIDQVKKDREALIAEQLRLQTELNAVSAQSQTLGTAVKSLDATKKKLQADINVTQSKIKTTTLTIQSLVNSMSDKENQIAIHREAISQTLLALSEHDSQPLLFSLLASTNLSEIWQDRGELLGLNTRLQDEIVSLRADNIALGEQKVETEKVKNDQLSLQGQLSGQKAVVEESQKAKQDLLNQTKNKEAEYQKLIADNIARQKQSESDLYQLETELAITIDPNSFPQPKHGVLSWPLDSVFINQKFGKTVGGEQLYAQGFHNGVDFKATMGTPVKAVLSGTIEGTGNTDEEKGCYSYGRWILIHHNNGLSTIYGHLSASLVQKGQTVTTGQIIGYSGGAPGADGAGYSTGPHLHVGLFASQGVEIKQFVTSQHCKNVYLPIAKGTNAYLDPLAYMPSL